MYGLLLREVPAEVGMAEARRVVDKAIDEAVLKTAALRGVEAPATAIEAQGVAALLAWSEEGLA